MAWHRVAALSEIAEGEAKPVRVGELEIALVNIVGTICAIEDVCPHAYALLSEGFVEDDEIECPLHGARFEISTGKVLCAPADRDLQTYPVRVDGDEVFVQVEGEPPHASSACPGLGGHAYPSRWAQPLNKFSHTHCAVAISAASSSWRGR